MMAEELLTELTTIYSNIKEGLDRTPEGLLEELDNRGQWLARSAELVAEAQAILDTKRGEASEAYAGRKESWSIIKALVERDCKLEKKIFTLADRLNATLTHQMDEVRSILSFEKESLRRSNGH